MSEAGVAAIERTLELQAAPEAVWRALTDPEQIAGWFSDAVQVKMEKGSEGWFVWQEHGRYAVRVEELDPGRRLTWRWARKPETPVDQGASTLVEWTLSPRDDGGTTLHLRESGFVREEDRQQNVEGWRAELAELQELLAAT